MSAMTKKRPPSSSGGVGRECGDRLKIARQALGYEYAKDFAKVLGLKEQTYRNYERGDRGVSYEGLQLIAEHGVSLEWVLLGRPPAVTSKSA